MYTIQAEENFVEVNALLKKQCYTEALSLLSELESAVPDSPQIYLLKALNFFMLDKREDAAQACERMLRGDLRSGLRPVVVDALFDYRPDEWYRTDDHRQPPDRSETSTAARAALRRIGEYVLEHVDLTERQENAVLATLRQLDHRPGREAGDGQ